VSIDERELKQQRMGVAFARAGGRAVSRWGFEPDAGAAVCRRIAPGAVDDAGHRELAVLPNQRGRPEGLRRLAPPMRQPDHPRICLLKALISRSKPATSSSNRERQYSGFHWAASSSEVFPCCSTQV